MFENIGSATFPGFPVAFVTVRKLVFELSSAATFRKTKFPGPVTDRVNPLDVLHTSTSALDVREVNQSIEGRFAISEFRR